MSCGISSSFPEVFPTSGQVTHVLLTRPPLDSGSCPPGLARLACVKHAASVHSEPGSNSPLKSVPSARPFGTRRQIRAGPEFIRKFLPCGRSALSGQKQQNIDVWHALLSFQGTGPPGPPGGGAVPPAQFSVNLCKPLQLGRNFSLPNFFRFSESFSHADTRRRRLAPDGEHSERSRNPCGDGQYRARSQGCQGFSKKKLSRVSTEASSRSLAQENGHQFSLFSRPSRTFEIASG